MAGKSAAAALRITSLLARYAQHFLGGGHTGDALAPTVFEDARRVGTCIAFEIGFGCAGVDQPAHFLIDIDEFVNAGATAIAGVPAGGLRIRPLRSEERRVGKECRAG